MLKDDIRRIVKGIDASVIVFGHNHLQGYGYCEVKLVINPGSCGLPLDFNTGAAYTILETTPNGYVVTEKRVAYDIEATVRCLQESAMHERGKVWSELVAKALRTGRDYFGVFFETAKGIAAAKNEDGGLFSNETWWEAYDAFLPQLKSGEYNAHQ